MTIYVHACCAPHRVAYMSLNADSQNERRQVEHAFLRVAMHSLAVKGLVLFVHRILTVTRIGSLEAS